jgi:hypothetical protein
MITCFVRHFVLVLEGPVTQTGKRPGLNRTITDRTGPAVAVLPLVASVRSAVH